MSKIASIVALSILTTVYWTNLYFLNDLFYSNQNAYFVHGMLLSGHHDYLVTDWYASTIGTHPVFIQLVMILERFGILVVGVELIEFTLYLVLVVSFWLIAETVIRAATTSQSHKLPYGWTPSILAWIVPVFLITMYIPPRFVLGISGINNFGDWIFDLSGFAGQYMYNHYLQPSEFAVLIFLGFALMQRQQWMIAGLLFAIATNFHVGYLINLTLVVVVYAAWLIIVTKQWQAAILLTLGYGLACLPIFIYHPLLFSMLPGSDEVMRIMTEERIPHHNLARVFFGNRDISKAIVLILGNALTLGLIRGPWRWVMPVGTGFILFAVGLSYATTSNVQLGMMQLWRGSVYYFPIALTIVISFLVVVVTQALRSRQRQTARLVNGIFVIVIMFLLTLKTAINFGGWEPGRSQITYDALLQAIQQETQADDVILIPTMMFELRLEAQRPIYVDWKALPYYPADVLEWQRRYKLANDFYGLSRAEQLTVCLQEDVDYFVMPVGDDYELIACDMAET